MNLDDMTPVGGGTLRQPTCPRAGRAVHADPDPAHPDEIWQPLGRVADITRGGVQGSPFGGYRPGHGLEHESVDKAERAAQNASHTVAAARVRAPVRPGLG